MSNNKQLRQHVLELLDGRSAHIDLASALEDFPADEINTRPANSPHTAWQLLEHIRIAQLDIVEFCRDPKHESPAWPDGYWPTDDGTAARWRASVKRVLSDLEEMRDLVNSNRTDLFAKIAHGDGQTVLREVLLVADHNAYHLGQIVMIKRILEAK